MTTSALRPPKSNNYPKELNMCIGFKCMIAMAGIIAAIAGGFAIRSGAENKPADEKPAVGGASDNLMFGGSVGHNMVNHKDTNIPAQLIDRKEKDDDGKERVVQAADAEVLWKAKLGSRAYGGPI